jgi:hexosaminidase
MRYCINIYFFLLCFGNAYGQQKLPVRLAALDKQHVDFRIPEPVDLKDSVTMLNNIQLNLKPLVEGASVYYTTDGSVPTQNSQKSTAPLSIALIDNIPVTIKTVTVLKSGRQSAVYTATYLKKANSN